MEVRNFCITAGGGLGDQVCAEPIIRWMVNSFYKNDKGLNTMKYWSI
jgi:hypothetical protein